MGEAGCVIRRGLGLASSCGADFSLQQGFSPTNYSLGTKTALIRRINNFHLIRNYCVLEHNRVWSFGLRVSLSKTNARLIFEN